MSDLISRDAAWEEIKKVPLINPDRMAFKLQQALWDVPAVDAVPAAYGYWQKVTANEFYGSGSYAVAGYVCSHCGFDIETSDYECYNYCPNCGAKMGE